MEKEKESKFETILEELEIDTTIHQELITEIIEVYDAFMNRLNQNDLEAARYLTIAYMVRRLSVRDLPLNKERNMKPLED